MIGQINSIETLGLLDGPGVRFVVFLQGCKNRCLYCHNPETFKMDGLEIDSQTLLKKILKYKNYFKDNGGVTFSGGEPLLQKDFLLEMLKLCKMCNIHTCLDTSGVGVGNYEEILKYTDLVMLDVKGISKEEFFFITKQKQDEFDKFVSVLNNSNKKVWIKQVIIPGINDNIDYINRLNEYIKKIKNIEKVELLGYHNYAIEKYKKLNIDYPLMDTPPLSDKRLKELQDLIVL